MRKSILIILIILCCNWNAFADKNVEYQNFRKEWKFQGFSTIKYGSNIANDDNSFLYATCIDDRLPTEVYCNVTIDTPVSRW